MKRLMWELIEAATAVVPLVPPVTSEAFECRMPSAEVRALEEIIARARSMAGPFIRAKQEAARRQYERAERYCEKVAQSKKHYRSYAKPGYCKYGHTDCATHDRGRCSDEAMAEAEAEMQHWWLGHEAGQ